MRVYYCTSFTGVQPTGVAAIVVAPDVATAHAMLNSALKSQGLPGDAKEEDMMSLPLRVQAVHILQDGDY